VERRDRRDRMLAALDSVDFESLVDRIERAMHGGPDDPEDDRALHSAMMSALAIRVARRSRDLRVAIEAAGALYAPEQIHAVRIAVKKLRYALELAYELHLLRSRRPITQLKAMQETLGRLHDDQMLIARVMHTQATRPTGDPAHDVLEEMVRLLEERCRERHALYLTQREHLLLIAEEALDALTGASDRDSPESPSATVH
jgi:CHAD domain-containing protein